MLCLFLKIKKKTWRYPNFAPAYQKSWWYDLHFLRYRVWHTEMKKNCWRYHHFTHVHQKPQSHEVQFLRCGVRRIELSVILGHFLHFYHLTTWTIKIWKNEKNIWRCHHFSHVPKIMITWRMLPEIWSATGIIFCHFGPFFALLPHYWPQKLTFGKNVKKTWRYYPFTNVYHKYRSYDVWFLRYKATTNRGFCHFDPPNNPKKTKILKKWKEQLETLSFYTCVTQMTIWCMVPEIWSATDIIFSNFGPFFALLPPNDLENKNFEKIKNHFT